MRLCLAFALGSMFLTGCQTTDDALEPTATPISVTGPAAGAIAGDMASRLAEQLPPAGTTLKMTPDKSEFAVALEAALKGWGYTLATDPAAKDAKPVELAYAVQGIDGQILARLSTPSIALGRAYSASPSGATPASPLSIMQRN